ncbi:ABC transporter permease [Chitinophaga defluvii]|uniref:ABC transporter permease n=1 Tax=Chitinophaga defluvii TaxID=3163343 RepID=A0ABV2TAN3_9BACT
MFKNYFKTAWRNLLKNKGYSVINIAGLAMGIAVALLIGLWIWDELSYDTFHQHYHRTAQVLQQQTFNGKAETRNGIPIPLANELRTNYGSDFKYVALSTYTKNHILSSGDKQLIQSGNFMEPDAPDMFSLKMLKGTRNGLKDPASILLSEKVAVSLFGNIDPVGTLIRLDDSVNVKVAGVYENLPYNSTLREVTFIAPWSLYASLEESVRNSENRWNNNGWQLYVQLADHADMEQVSAKIQSVKLQRTDASDAAFKPALSLHPMSKWHLYAFARNSRDVTGKVQYLWMFGSIGVFVLLLACINFMNLSTAQSEKRAKEVGVRKAVGSLRGQLIWQFLIESVLISVIALLVSLVLVLVALPVFNTLAGKQIILPWDNIYCWPLLLGITVFTGLMAGSYPALYLSGFGVVKVLKGTYKAGRPATLPRKVLVVLQFSIAVILFIGTITVFRQIHHTKDRPVGYSREGLITVETITPAIHSHFAAVRNDLLNTGMVAEAATSYSPATELRNEQSNFDWKGKTPGGTYVFGTMGVSQEYGKTVGWQIADGRDFSRSFTTDAMGFVINESAKKYMGLKNPIGETVHWMGYQFTIIGVVKDMVIQSPYEAVKPMIFYIAPWQLNVINIRIKPGASPHAAVEKIAGVFKKYNPEEPFNYKFVDETYAVKFSDEERIGRLTTIFTILAMLISCMGLFGLASYITQQRTKEIGVRKILGASVFNLWRLLAKDFIVLVLIALLIAFPVAYYCMQAWLQHYTYHATVPWWVFPLVGISVLFITLLTVSYQGIKTALVNPVKSLKME